MIQHSLTTLTALADRLEPIFRKYHVLRAIVFGSVARGEATRRSDLDLVVIQQTEKRFLDRYDGIFADLTQAVEMGGVDLLIYTPEEIEHRVDPRWIATILREGQVIYESNSESAPSGTVAVDSRRG